MTERERFEEIENGSVQDPAVPMIKLPMSFKSRRINTALDHDAEPEHGYVDVMDVRGCGCVRHLWFLYAEGRRIEITVDGSETPQVDMPLSAFFGIMHDLTPYTVDNAAFTVLPNYETPNMPGNPGYNCFLPIPFGTSCRIRLYLEKPQRNAVSTMVDWHEYGPGSLRTPFRLHAEHQRYSPAPPRNAKYRIAEVSGRGFVAGVVMGAKQRNYTDMIYHTGGMSILIDGEDDPHVIRGINMEDDFGFSWGFHPHQARWIGSSYHKWGGRTDQDGVVYRLFGPDPIAFRSSISFGCGSRDDDIETVAYYYKVPGTDRAPACTLGPWLVTGFYENGAVREAFEKREDVEDIPVGEWRDRFAERSHFVRELSDDHGWIDFRFSGIDPDLSATWFQDRSMYAGTMIRSGTDREAVLRLTFDDWLALSVNGRRLETIRHERGIDTTRVRVSLRKGENSVVIKNNNLRHFHAPWVANVVLEDASDR